MEYRVVPDRAPPPESGRANSPLARVLDWDEASASRP
jgi:hypothetical protein